MKVRGLRFYGPPCISGVTAGVGSVVSLG